MTRDPLRPCLAATARIHNEWVRKRATGFLAMGRTEQHPSLHQFFVVSAFEGALGALGEGASFQEVTTPVDSASTPSAAAQAPSK